MDQFRSNDPVPTPGAGWSWKSRRRWRHYLDRLLDLAMRVIPISAMVAIGAYVAAQQAVSPQRRVVKLTVLVGILVFMFRFDMVWSVYLFVLLFPFPSGIAIGNTNSILMTLIPLIWVVRATSLKQRLFRPTPADTAIGVFLIAILVSFYNVDGEAAMVQSVKVLWRQFAAFGFFYTIVTFVEDEARLERLAQVICVSCGLVMLTAVIELFFPGAVLIPGWIDLQQQLGAGKLSYRLEGLRVGGAFESHGMLADYGTQIILFMIYFTVRTRNPLTRAIWIVTVATTFVAIMATANRGATAGLILALLLGLLFFRRRLPLYLIVILIAGIIGVFVGVDAVLRERTVAASILSRFFKTEFVGVVPDTRVMTWRPALERSMDHIFIGHGPYYKTGVGLEAVFWPHNGYIFYLYTLGIFGLSAFFWILDRVLRCSQIWRREGIRGTNLGNLIAIGQIWFVVQCFEQLRTDHQRDDIYPYIVWMCFGFVVAGWSLAKRRLDDQSRTSAASVNAEPR
ncbi:MAG: O-antigen ligase family protein [Candidatus Krumholzibacteriota bacterium]|nr:O-antigen ligase family protein [Candidatus Krumholzibacteriota bacterium]